MCYEAFVNGDATAQSFRALYRAERRDAIKNGLEAATLVAVVLLWHGVSPVPTAVAALAALVAGYVLHQAVFVAGISVIRATASQNPDDHRAVS